MTNGEKKFPKSTCEVWDTAKKNSRDKGRSPRESGVTPAVLGRRKGFKGKEGPSQLFELLTSEVEGVPRSPFL